MDLFFQSSDEFLKKLFKQVLLGISDHEDKE